MPARSPQLLPPLAPALACPCRTPRALLVGDRPFRVVYRVRCMCTAPALHRACTRVMRYGIAVSTELPLFVALYLLFIFLLVIRRRITQKRETRMCPLYTVYPYYNTRS